MLAVDEGHFLDGLFYRIVCVYFILFSKYGRLDDLFAVVKLHLNSRKIAVRAE